MRKYLDYLLIKDIEFNEGILSNSLFISFDNISALRKEYKDVVSQIKKYTSYNIIKSDVRVLQEGYEQGLFVINTDEKDLFLRIVLSDKLIYDVLIYTINDMDLINRVFFSKKDISIPSEFIDMLDSNKSIIILKKENEQYRILKANPRFYELIKYEDWDYANKYQNVLNQKAVDLIELDNLVLYQSDNNIIEIKNNVYNKDNIYCLVEM